VTYSGVVCLLLCTAFLWAQTPIIPLHEIRAGMKGSGRTVFSGDRIEEFGVEILGVLENVGPQQSLILARLSGGPLAQTGVLQGMSGSPVYIGGRLAGAVALSFQFSKEPIAGIRPIEEMLRDVRAEKRRPASARMAGELPNLIPVTAQQQEIAAGGSRLVEIATPVTFSGFTRETIEHFAPQLRMLGLEPSQGLSGGGGSRSQNSGTAPSIRPGSMISVQLMTGDMTISAEGTVTHVEGKRIYAFGHRFLSIGDTELPFARAEVLTLLPNLASSFKISAAREWLGAVTADRSTVVAGELGRKGAMAPLRIRVIRRGSAPVERSYRMEMASDRAVAPFLFQMAVFSAIDATERGLGASSFELRGIIRLGPSTPPVRIKNLYSGDFGLAGQASVGAALPLFYALQSGFDTLKLQGIELEIESFPEKKSAQIAQVWASRASVRPGETVELRVAFTRDDGTETVRLARYTVPVGAPLGPMQFTVADGQTTNWLEYRSLLTSSPRSVQQLVSFLNGLRENTKAYIRVWRPDPVYQIQGEDLPNPPASIALLLGKAQASVGGPALRNAKLAELAIDAGGVAVSGSRTIQVEVKE